jgi:peptidyl-prolyl cis-trans isomerase B (cyclophilin B)
LNDWVIGRVRANSGRDIAIGSGKLVGMKCAFLALAVGWMAVTAWSQTGGESKAADKPVSAAATNEVAVLKTAAGELVVEFWTDVAPKTVENFKKLAQSKFYDGTAFHRIVKGFMIQGGDPNTKDPAKSASYGTGGPGYSIKGEFNQRADRKHVRGVISMARSQSPDSGGSQFFICLDPAPSLDGKYAAFGKLIKGEAVLLKLGDTPTRMNAHGTEQSVPVDRVGVESIRIVPAESVK